LAYTCFFYKTILEAQADFDFEYIHQHTYKLVKPIESGKGFAALE